MSSTEFRIGFNETGKISSKVLKPPGGECSDIFGSFSSPSQQNGRRQPPQQHQSSPIFGTEEPSPNNHHSATGRRDSDTQARLFGGAADEYSPRRVVDRMKSNIFADQGQNNDTSPSGNSKKQVRRNPITGEIYADEEEEENGTNGYQNGNGEAANPITGEGTTVQSNQATCVKIRNPPGGKSSGIF